MTHCLIIKLGLRQLFHVAAAVTPWPPEESTPSRARLPGFKLLCINLLMAALIFASGCRPAPLPKATVFSPIAPRILAADNALAEARALVALGPRAAGTPGARQAAGHLLVRLQAVGVQATLDAFTDETPDGQTTFWNVMGVIPAAGRRGANAPWIFLASHVDTKSGLGAGFEGANDSASSSGLLLELARVLQAAGPLPVNIRS